MRILKLLALVFVAVTAFAQTLPDQANTNWIVVGNEAQPIASRHKQNIQNAISAAGTAGVVVIPPDYPFPNETFTNLNNILIMDFRPGTFSITGGGANFSGSSVQGTINQINAQVGVVSLASPMITPGGATISGELDVLGNSAIEFNPDPVCGFYGKITQNQLCNLNDLLVWNPVGANGDNQLVLTGQFSDVINNPPVNGSFWAWNSADGTLELQPPSYLNYGTPTSQGNECAINLGGGTPVLKFLDLNNKAHDLLCVNVPNGGVPSNNNIDFVDQFSNQILLNKYGNQVYSGTGSFVFAGNAALIGASAAISDALNNGCTFGANGTNGFNIVSNFFCSNTNESAGIFNTTTSTAFVLGSPLWLGINSNPVANTAPTNILEGFKVTTGGVVVVGAVPTCAFTSGGGTTPACTLRTGSNNNTGTIIATTGTGSPAGTGTITLTFSNSPFGSHSPNCIFQASDGAAGQWNGLAVFKDNTPSTTSDLFTFTNGASPTALSTSTAYWINYQCWAY